MNLILQKRRCPSRQRRAGNINSGNGGEYVYKSGSNKLKSVTIGMGGSADSRKMSAAENFDYDTEGNLIGDLSKNMKIFYDWRSMPTEFKRENFCYDIRETTACDSTKLLMAYDGSGRRVSKTQLHTSGNGVWDTVLVTHYTGIGTEIRENLATSEPGTKVVVNMPQGLGRYGIEDADHAAENGSAQTFEWYLKNHLGSTMLVYGTQASSSTGGVKAAYDYRSFGEQIELTPPSTGKVTENFTGKEHDEEIELDYFGARYLDPMLGMWISVDAARQFDSPYLYMGNGANPIISTDTDGNIVLAATRKDQQAYAAWTKTLNKSEAEVVSRIEKSDIVVNWRLTDQPIKTMNNDPKTFEPMTAGGVTTGVDGERALNVTIFKGDLKNSGMHEFYHVDQANDFLQSDSKLTGTDWNKEYKANTLDYELDAFNRDGVNVTRENLKEGGYRW